MSPPDQLAQARIAWVNGDAIGTIRAAQACCTAPDPSTRARALVLCGRALCSLGQYNDASRMLRTALAIEPNALDAWSAIATLLATTGDQTGALNAWKRVALRSPSDPTPWTHLAELHRARQDYEAASAAMRQARVRAPERVALAIEEALDLRSAGLESQAFTAVKTALQRFPKNVFLHLMAAEAHGTLGRRDDSLTHLNRAVELDPRHIDARSRRATHYMQTRRIEDAAEDVAMMLQLEPDHAQVRLQAARLATVRGHRQEAQTLLASLLEDETSLSESQLGHALLYRAENHGKQGDTEKEWIDLIRGQSVLAQAHLRTGDDGTGYLSLLHTRASRMAPGKPFQRAAVSMPTSAPTGSALEDRPPVFMFGFPRSGTTLFENVLGAHPRFTATDELNLLGAVLQSIGQECGNVPPEDLSDAQVRHLRQVFAQKAERAGYTDRSTRLIDKNPLNFVFVDIVRRVFPDAPVVMILRDPRDCVWSAFRQPFEPHASLILTRDLSGTATLYAAALDLWHNARSIPGVRLLEVHYEQLVTNFEATARQLVAATGEDWDPSVLEFHRTLGKAFVRTPSFAAVGQRVNTDRLSTWKPHADQFATVLPVLQPYIDRYGIDAVLGREGS
ncbi:MAG: hypothetical protein CL927_15415 [Deltaproteobacteria bacterium]|nr:hypothetical protein [Deltaproteobacteria bacterium]HCH65293.1 hypothetical protein [Deltaproteobacteria bacterium]